MIRPPYKIEIKESAGKGFGVFAVQDIEAGEIIEECLLLSLPMSRGEASGIFLEYRFNYPQGAEWTEQVVATGYGSYYNHSEHPNAFWRDHPSIKAFQFIASCDIKKGDEICVYYGGENYWNDGRDSTILI